MAAGIPQVIRPLAFDQFDNATRVEAIQCGRWLRRDADLAKTLESILAEHSADDSAFVGTSQRLRDADAIGAAAREVETAFQERNQPT